MDLAAKQHMDAGRYQLAAMRIVRTYVEGLLDKSDPEVPDFDVYAVWFCKTLRNWKALLSTTLSDGMYYEVTHNGEKGETYLDAYKKIDNVCIRDADAVDVVHDEG